MSNSIVKNVVASQYKSLIDIAAPLANQLAMPPEGWIISVRKALQMSVIQLANRLNVTRALIDRVEKQETSGSVTLKSMDKIAKAMQCRFVYAIVPEESIDALILQQAKLMAKEVVEKASVHMALEKQALSSENLEKELERLTQEILKNKHANLWNVD